MFTAWLLFIQIIAESLPISSSGHVILMDRILNLLGCEYDSTHYSWIVDFLSHGPTIVIVFLYFFSTWWQLVFAQNFKWSLLCKKSIYMTMFKPLLFVLCADVVTFLLWILDLAHVSIIQQYFLPIGFLITAMMLYWSHKIEKKDHKVVSWSLCDAMALGVVQGFSLLPGISRFASTYSAGIFLGYQRSTSFALSFLIQFPLLLAGFVKAVWALHGAPLQQALIYEYMTTFSFGIIIVSATFISAVLFYWVGRLIEQNRLWYCAYYMIIPLIISLAL